MEDWNAKILWEGDLVKDLLITAGTNMSAPAVIFNACDRYNTALPLSYIEDKNILLAYQMNASPFCPNEVSPSSWWRKVSTVQMDKMGIPNRSLKRRKLLGYWETRGYPNNASLSP